MKIFAIFFFISILEICTSDDYVFRFRSGVFAPPLPPKVAAPFEDRLRRNVPLVECFEPKGLRVSIADMPELEEVLIHRQRCNNCYSRQQEEIKHKQNGRWVMVVPNAVINIGEVLKFSFTCKTNRSNYVVDSTTLVLDLIPAPTDLTFPKAVPELNQKCSQKPEINKYPSFVSHPPVGYCLCPPNNQIKPNNNEITRHEYNPKINSFNYDNSTKFPLNEVKPATKTDSPDLIRKQISTPPSTTTTTTPSPINLKTTTSTTTTTTPTPMVTTTTTTTTTTTPTPSTRSIKTTSKVSTKSVKEIQDNLQQTKDEIELLHALLEKAKKRLQGNKTATR